jgi:drug/metabolite transporter (DMT)-like permease
LLQFSVIGLSQPALVAVAAVPLLHERLRGSAALALPLAMAGAALVVLPDEVFSGSAPSPFAGIPTLAALAALACALCSALAHTFVRRATRPDAPDGSPPEAPETVVLYFSVLVTLGAAFVGIVAGDLAGPPPTMSLGPAITMLLAMSTAGVVGQLLLSAAYARAHAPATAMVGYARIPLGFAADVLLWGAIAGISGLLGAVLVLFAGILLLRSENAADG